MEKFVAASLISVLLIILFAQFVLADINHMSTIGAQTLISESLDRVKTEGRFTTEIVNDLKTGLRNNGFNASEIDITVDPAVDGAKRYKNVNGGEYISYTIKIHFEESVAYASFFGLSDTSYWKTYKGSVASEAIFGYE